MKDTPSTEMPSAWSASRKSTPSTTSGEKQAFSIDEVPA